MAAPWLKNNQSVVDRSDVVLIGVRPENLDALAAGIVLRPEQTVVSLVAGVSLPSQKTLFKPASVCRMMLTYAAEINRANIIMTDCSCELQRLFSGLGTLDVLDSEEWFDQATLSMCMNGWFYYLAEGLQDFLIKKNVPPSLAGAMRDCADYAIHQDHVPLGDMLRAIATDGTFTSGGLTILRDENALAPWHNAAEHVIRELMEK